MWRRRGEENSNHFEINAAVEVDQGNLKLDITEFQSILLAIVFRQHPLSLHHRYGTALRGSYTGRLERIPEDSG